MCAIPEDVSVVGFDDIEFAEFVTPTLTTIGQPQHELGRTGAGVLISALNGEAKSDGLSRCSAARARQHGSRSVCAGGRRGCELEAVIEERSISRARRWRRSVLGGPASSKRPHRSRSCSRNHFRRASKRLRNSSSLYAVLQTMWGPARHRSGA